MPINLPLTAATGVPILTSGTPYAPTSPISEHRASGHHVREWRYQVFCDCPDGSEWTYVKPLLFKRSRTARAVREHTA